MLSRAKLRSLIVALFLLLAGTVGWVVIAVPFSTPMPGFWYNAQEFASSGHIRYVFTPCGYPALVGLGVRLGGRAGPVIIQLLIYALILFAVFTTLRLLAVEKATAAIAACVLGFHPDLVINIKKIWDTDITVALLMLLFGAVLAVTLHGLTPARAVLIGIFWGLGINVRPNFLTLFVPIAFAFCTAPTSGNRIKLRLTASALTLAGAAFVVTVLSVLVHGSFYIPQNGPYNFYAGNNPFTERALLSSLNAEPSIYPSLLAQDMNPNVDPYDPGLRSFYVQHALLYIRQNLPRAAKLALLKLLTLLRPDTKIYPLTSLGGMVKLVLALAIPFWVVTILLLRGAAWRIEDWLFVVFALSYTAPFLLTNSDPRFRIPLDVLVLTHAIHRIGKYLPLRWQSTP
jgi:hypothetical protein